MDRIIQFQIEPFIQLDSGFLSDRVGEIVVISEH